MGPGKVEIRKFGMKNNETLVDLKVQEEMGFWKIIEKENNL